MEQKTAKEYKVRAFIQFLSGSLVAAVGVYAYAIDAVAWGEAGRIDLIPDQWQGPVITLAGLVAGFSWLCAGNNLHRASEAQK